MARDRGPSQQAQQRDTAPGLDHLQPHVKDWSSAVRALAFTGASLAFGGASSRRSEADEEARVGTGAAVRPLQLQLRPAPPPPLVLSPDQLKPGRVFIVANLQGAYYTLVELLSRHKFDFRKDNLLHLGNLVGGSCGAGAGAGAVQAGAACRSSQSLLKLVMRHNARGPMGANECLALLGAAKARVDAQRQQAEQLDQLQQAEQAAREAAGVVGAAPRRGLLSLQMRAAATPGGVLAQQQQQPVWAASPTAVDPDTDSGDSSMDTDDSSDDDSSDEEVEAPATPCRGDRNGSAAGLSGLPSQAAGYDTGALSYMMSMPTAVVLPAYGVVLQHAGPDHLHPEEQRAGYHVVFSHRGPGSAPPPPQPHQQQQQQSTWTGLASCRGVVRCAVLPPLGVLCQRSPRLAARLATGAGVVTHGSAITRGELLMELHEEPIAELDVAALQRQQQQQHAR